MRILFEGNLGSEAKILARVLRKAFSLRCKAEKKDLSSAFKSSRKLKGFVVRKTRKFRNCVLLTHRDIFVPKAKSREGDWIFGYAFGTTNQFFISVARLRSRDRRKYRKRLEFITIHELGHRLVKKQKHFKKFIWKNPKTGHTTDLGMHCQDNKCIMAEVIDSRDMDKHIRMNYKGHFCKRCKT